ncbi:MAG: MCE family protein [Solirubrobacterales bacterium]|nr:MCE family protein [Solirubrobacterales bacterium]
MSTVRVLTVAVLLGAVVLLAVALLGGGAETEYKLRFETAGQLVNDDDVQIGGRRVGSIKDVKLTSDNQAEVTIAVKDEFTPLTTGTTAIIRQTSLSGIANRYVALTKGPGAELEPDALLSAEKTTTPVDIDQLFATFDEKTRKGLQDVIAGSAQQLDGVAPQANEGLEFLNPALTATQRVVGELTRDQQVFRDFVSTTSRVTSAVAERRNDLSGLVANANRSAQAIGSENVALADALQVLPPTLRRANTTFVNLRSTLDDLDTLVDVSKPATKDLAPFLRQLRPLVADARPTIADLRQLVRAPGRGNDLVELLRKAPRLEREARPAFKGSIAALRKSRPVLEFIRPYTPELTGWLRDFGQTTANYDANGHFARVSPIFNAFSVNSDNVLEPNQSPDRPVAPITGQFRRCPGAATQPAADGSSPFRDAGGKLDCDPSQVIPGR